MGQETTTYDFYNKIFLKYGIELNPDTEVATTDQIIPLVKSDLGMAFVPEPMARESIEKNEIVEISLKEKNSNREVCIVHDCQHPLNSAARKLKMKYVPVRVSLLQNRLCHCLHRLSRRYGNCFRLDGCSVNLHLSIGEPCLQQ